MDKTNSLLAILICTALVIACNLSDKTSNSNSTNQDQANASPATSPDPATPSLPPLKDGVVLNVTIQEDPGRRPTVIGETNLPDGTEGIVSIQSKTTKEEGQDKFAVQGGRLKAGPFSNGQQGLEPGNYKLEVVVAIAQVQPPQVKAVIGEKGENLHGPLVERDGIGTSVRVTQDFQLDTQGKIASGTDKAAVNKSIQASLKEARAILQALQKLERQGREMESLRGDDVDKIKRCGDLMRARQSEAKSLKTRAEALPRERYALLLATAAGELHLCVSCMTKVIDQCDIARGSLSDAEKELNKGARK